MTADAAHVAAVRQAFYRTGMNEDRIPTDVEIAAVVERLTPLIRAQVAARLRAQHQQILDSTKFAGLDRQTHGYLLGLHDAARIAEGAT